MKKTLLLGMIVAAGCASSNGAKNEEKSGHKEMAADKETTEGGEMGVYVIEREIPGAKDMNWQEIAAKSNGVIKEMNGEVQWLHSYVTGDKVYCVYKSPGEAPIKTHAEKGGFPANAVLKVAKEVSPKTDPAFAEAVEADESLQTFVIEREIPGASGMNWEEIAAKSNGVIKEMNGEVQWSHSYVTDDKVFCVYRSPNPELIKTHADKGGFPANSVEQVHLKVGPQTAEQ